MIRHYEIAPGLHIRRRGRVWWIDIRRDGKRVKKSLHTSDRLTALRIAVTAAVDRSLEEEEMLRRLLRRNGS